jgi:hypothetical protein
MTVERSLRDSLADGRCRLALCGGDNRLSNNRSPPRVSWTADLTAWACRAGRPRDLPRWVDGTGHVGNSSSAVERPAAMKRRSARILPETWLRGSQSSALFIQNPFESNRLGRLHHTSSGRHKIRPSTECARKTIRWESPLARLSSRPARTQVGFSRCSRRPILAMWLTPHSQDLRISTGGGRSPRSCLWWAPFALGSVRVRRGADPSWLCRSRSRFRSRA